MLKNLKSTKSKTWPGEGGGGVGGDSRAECSGSEIDGSGMDEIEVDGGEIKVDEVGKKVQKLSKSKNLSKSKKTVRSSEFLTLGAKLAFTELRQAFIKAPILYHFDPECYIRIETDVSGYVIGGVFSQLTSDNLGQWHLVAFFSRKMIPAETRYETHDGELLAIVETFKIWRHYIEGSQHEVLVLTNYNNLRRFMEKKSLSSRQVRCTQELSHYHFWTHYCQGKANRAADALSRYLERSVKEEETLQAKNVKILHCLQSSLARVSGLLVNSSQLFPLHQIFICGTTVFLQLQRFWDSL